MRDLEPQCRHVLQIFEQGEEVADFKCYDCGIPKGEKELAIQTCTRKLQLVKLPEVLVVVLGRFCTVQQSSNFVSMKLKTPVIFPLKNWDLTTHVEGTQGSHHFSMLACVGA